MEWKGIDVSHWQGDIAWNKVKSDGISFAMIRTGAAEKMDRKFKANMEGALGQGIACGVYHYTMADTIDEARREADFVLKAIKPYELIYPVAFDIEDKIQGQLTNAQRTSLTEAFCSTIAREKYHVAIYSSLSWFRHLLDLSKLEDYDKWVAQWGSVKCDYEGELKIWQHTSKGKVNGIAGNVDMNIAYDDYKAIIKPKPVPIPEKPPMIIPPSGQSAGKSLKAGTMLDLKGTAKYVSSTANKSAGTLTGKYWIYDGNVINGRVRVTNAKDRVGKKPVNDNVTAFITVQDAKK